LEENAMPTSSPHVIEATEASFQKEVLEAAQKRPVVIDFWATWCEPCKTLGPTLEGLAQEQAGSFLLAKVDVDRNPRLAQYFQAQSIPMVIAVYQGALVDQFVGALPPAEVRKWLESVLARCGIAPKTVDKPPTEPEAVEAYWRAKIAKDAKDGRALLELGRLLLRLGRDQEATETLAKVEPRMAEFNAAQAALALRSLLAEVKEAGGDEAVEKRLGEARQDPEARYLMALSEGSRGQFPGALGTLVELVGTAPAAVRDRAKKAAGLIFEAAGRGDEAVEGLRRKLSRMLF
jgi:putative thioredoxin